MRTKLFILFAAVLVAIFLAIGAAFDGNVFSSTARELKNSVRGEKSVPRQEVVALSPEELPSVRLGNYPGSGAVSREVRSDIPRPTRMSRTEVCNLLESFGKPAKKDLEWILNDPREKEFSAQLERTIGKAISQSARDEIVESARLAWFRMMILQQKYAVGEIDFDTYMLGMEEMARMDKEVVVRNLSDEEYLKLMGEPKTARGLFETYPSEALPPVGYLEMQSLFPALRNDHPEVQSIEDVYSVVPKETVAEVLHINREDLLRQRELQQDFLAKRISEEDYNRELDALRETTSDRINSILSVSQKVFLFGESSDLSGANNESADGEGL